MVFEISKITSEGKVWETWESGVAWEAVKLPNEEMEMPWAAALDQIPR